MIRKSGNRFSCQDLAQRMEELVTTRGDPHDHPPPRFPDAGGRRHPVRQPCRALARRPPIPMRAFTISSASAMRASCTSPIPTRSFGRCSSASRASISASDRCGAIRRIWSDAAFLDRFGIRPDSADAYAFTCIEFEKAAGRFGKLGGFAHLKTLVDRMRSEAGAGRALLLDGGDLWQGTGLPTRCRAPTWWTPPTCSASRR